MTLLWFGDAVDDEANLAPCSKKWKTNWHIPDPGYDCRPNVSFIQIVNT